MASKLVQDFGVRALLATLLVGGLIVGSLYSLFKGSLDLLKEFLSAYGPFAMAALTYYFATRGSQAVRQNREV